MTNVFRALAIICTCLLTFLNVPNTNAHTLGIDKAELIELPGGKYSLVSKVPARLAHLISAPTLPSHCTLQGSPRGKRGPYEVRFTFTCTSSLTANDTLILPWKREGAMLTVSWQDKTKSTKFVGRDGQTIKVDLRLFLAGSGSWVDAAKRYTELGIEHILLGIDHLLFVFGLLLLVRGTWMLIKTITAFTIAHSLTLALATLGFVNVPSAPVEAAIALSIVFLAVEILNGRRGKYSLTHRQPWIVAFIFGLLHGLGFAGALSEIGLPPNEIPIALLFFNIGVEIGQLLFVAVILAIWWALKNLRFIPPSWVEPIPTYALGTVAMFWFFERASAIIPVS